MSCHVISQETPKKMPVNTGLLLDDLKVVKIAENIPKTKHLKVEIRRYFHIQTISIGLFRLFGKI